MGATINAPRRPLKVIVWPILKKNAKNAKKA
jgi:hypothetical protein